MNNKIIYLMLSLVLVLLINNTMQDCSSRKRTDSEFKKQIARSEQIAKEIEKLAERRIDSTHTIERKIIEKIIEKEKVQHEIYNITNLDSAVKRYYNWRPEPADSTDR